jgi:hypothetical protein
MTDAIENILNLVVKPRNPNVEKITVKEDDDSDVITYKIMVIVNKHEAIYDRGKPVKDIENVLKSLGIGRRNIENIYFALNPSVYTE